MLLLPSIGKYKWIFIHRESIILGSAWYEWILARILRCQLIYDFDDAIWNEATSQSNWFVSTLKSPTKTSKICKLSKQVSVGNGYLAKYARNYNKQVSVVPTTIDTKYKHNVLKQHLPQKVVIGWTGSHSTLGYLSSIIPILSELEKSREFEFKVIADQEPSIDLSSYRFSKWDLTTEIQDLLEIDIGLMPLPDDGWAKGKCGLKALQYMSLGIPALVSPVGVNKEIVTHGVEGFHCSHPQEWRQFILKLINDTDLRNEMGKNGREKVINDYSVEAVAPKFLSLFK